MKKKAIAATLALPFAVWWATRTPSNTRDWTPDNARVPTARFRGDSVYVHNVRNADYRTTSDYTVRWEDRAYDLRQVERAWFLVEPFSRDWRGPAHTLVSFQFADGRFLAVSAEIRKEKGETFSPWKGLLRQFEMIYVVADERDVVRLRTNYRHDPVYLYPGRADRAKVRALLVDMLTRANGLAAHPEFYNTLTNTCTTSIVGHVNEISPRRVPFSVKVLFPGYSDRLAYDLGLIDTDLPFEQARERYHVNARAQRWGNSPDFSQRIRELPAN
ncbi:MAG TPA: DUF4105 domain-containing protein [Longimicrobium sp.]|nr:DUF4105 domain-containing protein [Longimicrobium sp.]